MAVFLEHLAFFSKGKTLYSLDPTTKHLAKHILHTDKITSIKALPPKLYTGGDDSKIVIWSFPDYLELEVSAPVRAMAVTPQQLFFVRGQPQQVNVIDLATRQLSVKTHLRDQVADLVDMEVSSDFLTLVVLTSHKVFALDLTTEVAVQYHHKVPMSCLAIHPDKTYVAAGDVAGQIIKFFPNTQAKSHWHSHTVAALKFTPDRGYCLSGGEEGVVVMWHEQTGTPSFLPRLGGSIVAIDVNAVGNLYLVKLKDGTVSVISSDNTEVVAKFDSLTDPASVIPNSKVWAFVKQGSQLVMNASPGYIQIYDLKTKEVKKVDCSMRNPVSRSDHEYPHPLQVVQVAFYEEFMATLETAVDAVVPLSYMKFWRGTDLVTLILHPHSDTAHRLVALPAGFLSLGKREACVWEWTGNRFATKTRLQCGQLRAKDVCTTASVLIAFEHIIQEFTSTWVCASELFEPFNEEFCELCQAENYLVARTVERLYVYADKRVLWSLELFYVHSLYTEQDLLLVSVNASRYTPIEERVKRPNLLLKFELASSRPVQVYRVKNPRACWLEQGHTQILNEFFEVQGLDEQIADVSEELTLTTAEAPAETQPSDSRLPQAIRYVSNKPLYFLETVDSKDLPELHAVFSRIVLHELDNLAPK